MSGQVTQDTIDTIAKDIGKFGDSVKDLSNSTQRELKAMRDLIDETGKKADTVVTERLDKFAASIETKQGAIESGLSSMQKDVDKVQAFMKEKIGGGFAGDAGAAEAKAAFDWHKQMLAKKGQLVAGIKISDPDMAAIRAYNAVFPDYIRRDERGVPVAALQTGNDPDGGYLLPTTISTNIVKKIYETSPMREVSKVETVAAKELIIPRDEGEVGYGWIGETTAPTDTTTAQFGESKIQAFEMYAMPKASLQMLEDAGIDVEAWLADKVSDKFGRVEADAFLNGNGVNKPRGLLTYGSGTTNGTIEQIVSGAATSVTFDGLINLVYSLKDFYAANASFLMHRLCVRDIMKLKDGDGQYIWQPSKVAGEPSVLLGYQQRRAQDMVAFGAGTLSVAFGDFKRAYTIVDRLGMNTLRDPYSSKPYVLFYTRRRVGGDVVNFEAVKLMVTST